MVFWTFKLRWAFVGRHQRRSQAIAVCGGQKVVPQCRHHRRRIAKQVDAVCCEHKAVPRYGHRCRPIEKLKVEAKKKWLGASNQFMAAVKPIVTNASQTCMASSHLNSFG
jgi:hypothetical protein